MLPMVCSSSLATAVVVPLSSLWDEAAVRPWTIEAVVGEPLRDRFEYLSELSPLVACRDRVDEVAIATAKGYFPDRDHAPASFTEAFAMSASTKEALAIPGYLGRAAQNRRDLD
jgi:hypothetical protein